MNHENNTIHNQNNNNQNASVNSHAIEQLQQNWGWFLGLGIGLVVLGSLAVMFSLVSTIVSMIYFGFFLIMVGFFEAVKSFKVNKWGSFFLHVFLSLLYIACGCFIVFNPTANAISLTLFLAILFIIAGLFRIYFALTKHVPHQWLLLLNGVASIILGALVWYEWPQSGLWVIGTFVGIEALFTGWTWIMLAVTAKRYKTE